MRDPEIRKELRRRLQDEYGNDPSTLILDELGVCCGQIRADMAVVNKDLKGFEIKSDQDTLIRLESQTSTYCRVFDTVSIVVALKHFEKATKRVPSWWGILIAECTDFEPNIVVYREEKENPAPDPLAIAQLVWRDEAWEILKAHHLHFGLRARTRHYLWAALVNSFSLEHLRLLVRTKIKQRRDWRSAASRTQCDATSQLSATSSDFRN